VKIKIAEMIKKMNIESTEREKVKDFFKRTKAKKFIKSLIAILEKNVSNLREFYDFYGEFIKANRTFALNKCYHLFRTKASKIISVKDLVDMDDYILNNLVFTGEEKLITSFMGNFKRPKAKLKGHIFLTNFRFLGTGVLVEKGSTPVTGPKSLLAAGVAIAKVASRDAIRNALVKGMGQKFSEEALNIFDNHFPIIDAFNITRKKDHISYSVKLEYEKRNKTKQKNLDFSVKPKREKGEDKSSFQDRREQILNEIESTLLKSQSV